MQKIKVSELNLAGFKNEYHIKSIQDCIKQAEEVSKFYPAEACVKISGDPDNAHLEWTFIKLLTPNFDFEISFYSRDKKWHIIERSTQNLKFMPYDNLDRVKKDLNEEAPNLIGVLTTKKIEQWIAYRTKFILAVLEKQKEIIDRVSAFQEKVGKLPHYWKNTEGTWGLLRTAKHEYEYKISDSGWIQEKIEYTGPKTLDAFAALT